jgi:hypothetical protein
MARAAQQGEQRSPWPGTARNMMHDVKNRVRAGIRGAALPIDRASYVPSDDESDRRGLTRAQACHDQRGASYARTPSDEERRCTPYLVTPLLPPSWRDCA